MLQFQQNLFCAVFFTNDVMCRGHYDIIYHPLSHQVSIFEDNRLNKHLRYEVAATDLVSSEVLQPAIN